MFLPGYRPKAAAVLWHEIAPVEFALPGAGRLAAECQHRDAVGRERSRRAPPAKNKPN